MAEELTERRGGIVKEISLGGGKTNHIGSLGIPFPIAAMANDTRKSIAINFHMKDGFFFLRREWKSTTAKIMSLYRTNYKLFRLITY